MSVFCFRHLGHHLTLGYHYMSKSHLASSLAWFVMNKSWWPKWWFAWALVIEIVRPGLGCSFSSGTLLKFGKKVLSSKSISCIITLLNILIQSKISYNVLIIGSLIMLLLVCDVISSKIFQHLRLSERVHNQGYIERTLGIELGS